MIHIWACSNDFASAQLAYDNMRPDKRDVEYEARPHAAACTNGLLFIGDFPFGKDQGARELLWHTEGGEIQRLSRNEQELVLHEGIFVLGNYDGTGFLRCRSSYSEKLHAKEIFAEFCDLSGKPVKDFKVAAVFTNFPSPVLMDNRSNIYCIEANTDGTRRSLGMINPNDGSYTLLVRGNLAGQAPLLTRDGITVATYVHKTDFGNSLSVQYYRAGKLVKSANDPVPENANEVRLSITSDGEGVVTQVTSGEKKGLVKVWNIESGKTSEIDRLPEIRYIFPWVQGKYAPVWTSSDGKTYEAGLLEVTRSN